MNILLFAFSLLWLQCFLPMLLQSLQADGFKQIVLLISGGFGTLVALGVMLYVIARSITRWFLVFLVFLQYRRRRE